MSMPEDVPLSLLAAASTSLPTDMALILVPTSASLIVPSTTASIAGALATAALNSTASGTSRPGAEDGECKLLGPFALFIQGALGLLALLSLVFKRWRERPQRPVKIWAFDASKQVVGSALLHVANLVLSMISSGELIASAKMTGVKAADYQANPCSFYLLNLAIDTTLGIPILIGCLKILTYAFSLTPLANPPESIKSGNYGDPPKTIWWLKQCFIYFLGLLGMKICVFIIFQICPWIIQVGDWALRWTEGNQTLQIFFVMLFFPVVMNALQYYIIDSFIKDSKPAQHETEAGDDGEDDDMEDSEDGIDEVRDGEEEAALIKKDAVVTAKEKKGKDAAAEVDPKAHSEYDPALDGASSNSSRREEQEEHEEPRNTRTTTE